MKYITIQSKHNYCTIIDELKKLSCKYSDYQHNFHTDDFYDVDDDKNHNNCENKKYMKNGAFENFNYLFQSNRHNPDSIDVNSATISSLPSDWNNNESIHKLIEIIKNNINYYHLPDWIDDDDDHKYTSMTGIQIARNFLKKFKKFNDEIIALLQNNKSCNYDGMNSYIIINNHLSNDDHSSNIINNVRYNDGYDSQKINNGDNDNEKSRKTSLSFMIDINIITNLYQHVENLINNLLSLKHHHHQQQQQQQHKNYHNQNNSQPQYKSFNIDTCMKWVCKNIIKMINKVINQLIYISYHTSNIAIKHSELYMVLDYNNYDDNDENKNVYDDDKISKDDDDVYDGIHWLMIISKNKNTDHNEVLNSSKKIPTISHHNNHYYDLYNHYQHIIENRIEMTDNNNNNNNNNSTCEIKHDNDYIHNTIMKSLIRNNKKRIDENNINNDDRIYISSPSSSSSSLKRINLTNSNIYYTPHNNSSTIMNTNFYRKIDDNDTINETKMNTSSSSSSSNNNDKKNSNRVADNVCPTDITQFEQTIINEKEAMRKLQKILRDKLNSDNYACSSTSSNSSSSNSSSSSERNNDDERLFHESSHIIHSNNMNKTHIDDDMNVIDPIKFLQQCQAERELYEKILRNKL
jgi:hypothetical protein